MLLYAHGYTRNYYKQKPIDPYNLIFLLMDVHQTDQLAITVRYPLINISKMTHNTNLYKFFLDLG